jgi:hypothetical protein
MATIKEYYETDFSNTIRIDMSVNFGDEVIEGCILNDFSAYAMYLAFYIESSNKSLAYFTKFITFWASNNTVTLGNRVLLPSAKTYHGELKIENPNGGINVLSRFFGDTDWQSNMELLRTKRVFIYSESTLNREDQISLNTLANSLNVSLQFRSTEYRQKRADIESPLAFISHDSKDKERVARPIATRLQQYLTPVWYDEFSLNVGDNLRQTIEKGLKECRKCILILSPNFLTNNGWTKTEFDSIFTRQILEEDKLILPVWVDVTPKQVYDYSPSLLNVLGLKFNELGIEEVSRRLNNVIKT